MLRSNRKYWIDFKPIYNIDFYKFDEKMLVLCKIQMNVWKIGVHIV